MSGTEQVLYANVIVDISHEKLDKIFQYRVPDVLRMQIHPGTAVTVPFGNGNRRIQGYVVKLTGQTIIRRKRSKKYRESVQVRQA